MSGTWPANNHLPVWTPRPRPMVLPYPSLGSLFKGRDALLARIHDAGRRGGHFGASLTVQVLEGIGGVGKTRAAVEYAWAHQADYTAVLFVHAETPDRLRSSLAALAGPLYLTPAPPDEDARVEAVLSWLNGNPGWLLILDNIDTGAAFQAVHRLLGRLSGGHVVVTSRLTRFSHGVERLDLDMLTVDDAADFLLAATPNRRMAADDADQARRLAEALGLLPLALEMAAATIEARRFSVLQYRAQWDGNRARVIGWARPEIGGYPLAVAETWQSSVDQLPPEARTLLERLAFLAPDPVPLSLLDVAAPDGMSAEATHTAFEVLVDRSLAELAQEDGTFAIHRLLQDATRRHLDASMASTRLVEALTWIDAAFSGDPDDPHASPALDPLVPHALTVVWSADRAGITDPTKRLMETLGVRLYHKGALASAEPLMRRALAIDEASFPANDTRIAAHFNNLARLLKATNRLGEAEPLMRRALAIDEASYGQDHPEVAIDLNNLAGLLQDTNRLGEAEPLMRRALAIDEASYGHDHPEFAIRLNNLATLLQDTNRLGEAEPLMRRALAIAEASYGQDHPRVAIDLNNLAQLLQDTNRLDEAEPLMRRALAIDEASYGQDHPNVATDLNNLAGLLQATNRLDEAEPLMRRALAIDEANYGKDHPSVAIHLNNLAQLLQDTNRLGEAEPLMRRALAIDEASFGQDHPNVAIRLNNLAQLLKATNRLGEAEPLMRRALAIDEASYGKDHPSVAIHLNNLAGLLYATNRLGEAEPLMRRQLAIFLRFQGDTGHAHPHRDAAIGNYGGLLEAMGKSEDEIAATIRGMVEEAGVSLG